MTYASTEISQYLVSVLMNVNIQRSAKIYYSRVFTYPSSCRLDLGKPHIGFGDARQHRLGHQVKPRFRGSAFHQVKC